MRGASFTSKCDFTLPCSCCVISSRACSYNLPPRKRGPKGPRGRPPSAPQSPISSVPALSPCSCSGSDGPSPVNERSAVRPQWKLQSLHQELIAGIRDKMPSSSVPQIVRDCLSLFFQRSFPTLPICHEPSLRGIAEQFFERTEGPESVYPDPGSHPARVKCMRSFGLVTAVCAATSLVHQKCCLLSGETVGPLFLEAARRMLREYEDHDIQHPDSTSLQIRMLLSTCLQHHAGENALAWHIVSQAGLIARQMGLYTENAVMQHDPLESTLLRLSFWTLHMADNSAACVQNRGVVLHESLLHTAIDVEEFGSNQVPLLDADGAHHEERFERSLLSGFHTLRRLWAVGAKLMLAIHAYGRNASREKDDDASVAEKDVQHISELYAEVLGALDNMPPSLQSAACSSSFEDTVDEYHASCYKSQRFRLLSTYHSLKLMTIYQCGQHGLASALGLRDEPGVIAMEKVKTARDYIHNLQSVPFYYIKCNGETGAELMRVVGSVLLEIHQNSPDGHSRQQADSLLTMLLNILAKFDSRSLIESIQQRTASVAE